MERLSAHCQIVTCRSFASFLEALQTNALGSKPSNGSMLQKLCGRRHVLLRNYCELLSALLIGVDGRSYLSEEFAVTL
jgi:hypothetical protein